MAEFLENPGVLFLITDGAIEEEKHGDQIDPGREDLSSIKNQRLNFPVHFGEGEEGESDYHVNKKQLNLPLPGNSSVLFPVPNPDKDPQKADYGDQCGICDSNHDVSP